MSSKRSITVTISILLFAAGIKLVLACSDSGSFYDEYVSFFQNNITAQPQYSPFYYTDFTPFYGQYDNDLPEDDTLPDGNIEEWYAHCNKAAARADIDSFMNRFSYSQAESLKRNNAALTKQNSFCRFLAEPQHHDLLDYLLLAKKCEPLNASLGNYWDSASNSYKTQVRNSIPLWLLVNEAAEKGAATGNEFLKWRYAYQALRLLFNNGQYQKTLEMYEKLVGAGTAKNIMYPRCLGLKAGALYRTGHKKEAAYCYSRAFSE